MLQFLIDLSPNRLSEKIDSPLVMGQLLTPLTGGGSSFVRVDVPEVEAGGRKLTAFSKLFGASSIYCLSPCTEETARAFAAKIRSESFHLYEAPRLTGPATDEEPDELADFDD